MDFVFAPVRFDCVHEDRAPGFSILLSCNEASVRNASVKVRISDRMIRPAGNYLDNSVQRRRAII